MTVQNRFDGKVAVITGGGSGIGKAAAVQLVKEGARVVINGRTDEKLRQAASEIDPSGDRVAIYTGDIGKVATAQGLVAFTQERFGGVDILLNNAGVFKPKPFLEISEEEYDWFSDTILKGKFFTAQAAAASMKARGGGVIVHTGSMWALQAIAATPSSAYSAANAGVHQLVKNLALELASDNIRINGVAPAVVETPVYSTFLSPQEVSEVLPSFNAFHPLGRNGQPEDVVNAILFLASAEADWITGSILSVDGGVMAGH